MFWNVVGFAIVAIVTLPSMLKTLVSEFLPTLVEGPTTRGSCVVPEVYSTASLSSNFTVVSKFLTSLGADPGGTICGKFAE